MQGQDVAIVSVKAHPASETTIARAFERAGRSAFVVADGDPAGLSAKLLVLPGSCRSYLRYPRILKAMGPSRPRVAAWHFEPLPPAEMDRGWDDLAIWRLLETSRSRATRWAKRSLLFPLFALAAWRLSRNDRAYRYHASNFILPFQSYLVLRDGVRDGWLDAVFVTTNQKVEFLASRGIAATFAPFGFYDKMGEVRQVDRDVDVVFLGTVQNERLRTLARVVEEAKQLGVEVRVVDRNCWGEKRTSLLNRTKIMLHLHNFRWDTPWQRWMIAGSNGAMVVSEPLSLPAPMVPGVHYAEAPIEAMAETLRHYVTHAAERQRMADALARLVREDLTLDASAARILDRFGMLAPRPTLLAAGGA